MLVQVLYLVGQLLLGLLLLSASAGVVFMYSSAAARRAHFMSKSFPQPTALPVIGHLFHVCKPRDEIFCLARNLREAFGTRFVISMFARPTFNISDPESVEAVLSSSKHTSKSLIYEFLRPWLGQGLLTSGGQLWHSRRKLLTPAFHFRILDQFSEHMEQQADTLVEELALLAAPGDPVDVVPVISRTTLRAICVTAMGKIDFQTDSAGGTSEKDYFDAIHRVGTSTVHRMVRPWLWVPQIFKRTEAGRRFKADLRTLHTYTAKMIAERKKALFYESADTAPGQEHEGVTGAARKRLRPFLDVLLTAQRDGASLSDKDIREEVDTFMFEGHDTTSMALSWALELMGKNQGAQERLADELVAAGRDWESVAKLPYLDMVFKECLRLRPSVPFISRFIENDVVLSNGQVLPASSAIHVHIYDLHRHPDHFPDPERFDPERFHPQREHSRHPFAYVPFSAGPRNCIGKRFAVMEVKLLLAAVVRHFHIRSVMPDKLDAVADLVLRPRAGVMLELSPRSSS